MERTVQDIDKEIAVLEAKYNEVKGTQTEVYTRIVGYFRSVANWNRGKREEYNYRKTFEVNDKQIKQKMSVIADTDKEETRHISAGGSSSSVLRDKPVTYKLFHSKLCRNCPPVVRFMKKTDIQGEMLDVSGSLGVELAKQYGVKSTPTVLLFDANDNVVGEMHTVEELQNALSSKVHNVAV